jgi:hypothetical protein
MRQRKQIGDGVPTFGRNPSNGASENQLLVMITESSKSPFKP